MKPGSGVRTSSVKLHHRLQRAVSRCKTGVRAARAPAGVLDRRAFERVKVEIGRCDVCGTGKAVYRSREAQAKVWEGCYARLMREGNRGEGEVDYVNCMPNYGYLLLEAECLRAVNSLGLDAHVGFLHEMQAGKNSWPTTCRSCSGSLWIWQLLASLIGARWMRRTS